MEKSKVSFEVKYIYMNLRDWLVNKINILEDCMCIHEPESKSKALKIMQEYF